ncbi:TspO/MBR family protein [Paenibacillus sp. GCM10023252]|uniref:TspO/MBR family protein n=1 Tax=Paenibacillus sp. GCM10023252 TaxID=3252649 RepID=UPI003618B594
MNQSVSYRWLNALGVIAVIVINALATLLPINGKTTGELSDQYPVLITPAGYAFSIWSVIYALLIGFVIYSFTSSGRESQAVQSIGPWFLVSCLFNIAWILAWHYELVTASAFIMLGLLLTLIMIYTRVQGAAGRTSWGEKLLVQLPFSLYLGWISVATIVNVTIALSKAGMDDLGLSAVTWTVIGLVVATVLGLLIGWIFKDGAYMLVFVWAFIAIAQKQGDESTIANTAIGASIILAIAIVAVWMTGIRKSTAAGRPRV